MPHDALSYDTLPTLSLDDALAGGVPILVANRARGRLIERYVAATQAAGTAWETPRHLTLSAFLEELFKAEAYGACGDHPVLIDRLQGEALWRQVVATEGGHDAFQLMLRPGYTADLARLRGALASVGLASDALEDPSTPPRLYLAAYEEALAELNAIDADGLTLQGEELIARAAKSPAGLPARLLLTFVPDPAASRLLQALEAAGCTVHRLPSATAAVECLAFPTFDDELATAAAQLAQQRLDRPSNAMPAVLAVASLATRRSEVLSALEGAIGPEGSGNWSFVDGEPLAAHGAVKDAFTLLTMTKESWTLAELQRLLRAVYAGADDSEQSAWLLLEQTLVVDGRPRFSREALVREATKHGLGPASCLLRALEETEALATSAGYRQTPMAWVESFGKVLDAVGWPGQEQRLDDASLDAVDRFRNQLDDLVRIGPLTTSWDFRDALGWLRRAIDGTTLRTHATAAPVLVLDAAAADLPVFTDIMVVGLTEQHFFRSLALTPFLSGPLATRVRGADEAGYLQAQAALALDAWRGARGASRLSFSHRVGDEDQLRSPRLGGVPVQVAAAGVAAAAFVDADPLEAFADDFGLPLRGAGERSGGTALFGDQAACPFRAYASHRLGLKDFDDTGEGLNASEQGVFLHWALKELLGPGVRWEDVQAWGEQERRERIAAAVASARNRYEAKFGDRSEASAATMDLEQERMMLLLAEWLDAEAKRTDGFEVLAVEEELRLTVGEVTVSGRFDRLDRNKHGGLVVIDYKSGACTASDWRKPRLQSPQLPLYGLQLAAGRAEPLESLAFAQLKPGEMGFKDFDRGFGVTGKPPKKEASDKFALNQDYFDLVTGHWQASLEGYAEELAAGFARVAPFKQEDTCKYCRLEPLCRVADQTSAQVEDDEDEEFER